MQNVKPTTDNDKPSIQEGSFIDRFSVVGFAFRIAYRSADMF